MESEYCKNTMEDYIVMKQWKVSSVMKQYKMKIE